MEKQSKRLKEVALWTLRIGIVLGVIACAYWFGHVRLTTGPMDAVEIVNGAHDYVAQLKANGKPVPPTVTLKELLKEGYVRHDRVSGYDGWHVTVSLEVNPKNPQAVLVEARSPQGQVIRALADGSVQESGEAALASRGKTKKRP